jgi:hypothetical protein
MAFRLAGSSRQHKTLERSSNRTLPACTISIFTSALTRSPFVHPALQDIIVSLAV